MGTERRSTTIEQHRGTHHTGLRSVELVDVVSEYEIDEPTEEDVALVDEAHELRVAIESLDVDARAAAWARVHDAPQTDMEDEVSAMRAALAQARREGGIPRLARRFAIHRRQS